MVFFDDEEAQPGPPQEAIGCEAAVGDQHQVGRGVPADRVAGRQRARPLTLCAHERERIHSLCCTMCMLSAPELRRLACLSPMHALLMPARRF